MKVDVDYEVVLNGIDKLVNNELLTNKERLNIVNVLKAVQGDYIPTREEFDEHKMLMDRLDRVDFDKQPTTWNFIADKLTEYENKYC